MIIPTDCVGKNLLPYMGEAKKHPTLCLYKNLILYHVRNFRTPLPPVFHDWHNLYDLPTEHEKYYCWKCNNKTMDITCKECGYSKFFMTNG